MTKNDRQISPTDPRQDLQTRFFTTLSEINKSMGEIYKVLFQEPYELLYYPTLDLFQSDDLLIMEVVLPGIDPDRVQLRVEQNWVYLKGEVLTSFDFEEENSYILERSYGPFRRRVDLPVIVNPTEAAAYYRDGVLRLEMPVEEEEGKLPGADIIIEEEF